MRRSKHEDLLVRASRAGGDQFAERIKRMIEQYHQLASEDWPKMPLPKITRAECERISDASTELIAAIAETSPAVLARLRAELQRLRFQGGVLEPQRAPFDRINSDAGDLVRAACTIRCAQPRTKPTDAMRAGFVEALRNVFLEAGVRFTATVSQSRQDQRNSLAVDAVCAALKIKAEAARAVIRRTSKGTHPAK